jgi:soluble lytic murein transglycosylase-like protein
MRKMPAKFGWLLIFAVSVCLAADERSARAPIGAESSIPGVAYVANLQNGFSIRFDHRSRRSDTSRLFLTADENSYLDVPTSDIKSLSEEKLPENAAAAPTPAKMDIPAAVTAASNKHGIDADLLYSVIGAESGFNPRAVSRKGAQGLMQLMPGTADQLGVQDAFDPRSNVDGGTRYLRELLDRYHYDLAKALAAYNAGPQRVEQYHGVPPYRETRAYVSRIIRAYNRKKRAQLADRKARAGKKSAANNAAPAPASGS